MSSSRSLRLRLGEILIKNRYSVPSDGIEKVIVIDNSKSGKGLSWSQDKGHYGESKALAEGILNGNPSPISVEELALTTLVTFKIYESLKSGMPVSIDLEDIGLAT